MILFTGSLWNLSGPGDHAIHRVATLPKAMFVIGIVYIVFATGIAFWVPADHPVVVRQREVQRRLPVRVGAAARRVRGSRFYRGEVAERAGCAVALRPSSPTLQEVRQPDDRVSGWNVSISQAQELIPYLVQFQRFYNGEITLGALSQTADAFRQILTGLSFFRNAYDDFAAIAPRSSGSTDW